MLVTENIFWYSHLNIFCWQWPVELKCRNACLSECTSEILYLILCVLWSKLHALTLNVQVNWTFVRCVIGAQWCDITLLQHYTNDARLQVEHSNMLSRGWHVITRAQPEWWHFNRGTTYLNVPRASMLHLFCRMTNYEQVGLQNPGAVCMTRS